MTAKNEIRMKSHLSKLFMFHRQKPLRSWLVNGSQDVANLRNSTYRRQMALAIARGTLKYIQQNRL
jgi:hypothetical protein